MTPNGQRLILATATLGLLACVPLPKAHAQTTGATAVAPGTPLLPTKNTKEIGFAASVELDEDNPYAISATYGMFTSPVLELGLNGSIAGAKHTSTFSSLGVFGDYYFRGSNRIEHQYALLPYVGLFAGYSHRDESNASLGGQVGAKYFLNPSVAVFGEFQYRSTKHSGGNKMLVFGISTFFH